jgi:hypothetical protein
MDIAYSTYRERRIFMGKLEEKRPLGRRRCRREDNVEVDLEIG